MRPKKAGTEGTCVQVQRYSRACAQSRRVPYVKAQIDALLGSAPQHGSGDQGVVGSLTTATIYASQVGRATTDIWSHASCVASKQLITVHAG
jgi:hypothetical protein